MLKNFISKLIRKTISATRTSSGEFLLRKTDYGIVYVEYSVIQKIAERALSNLRGVSNTEIRVEKSQSTVTPIKISLTMTLAAGYSAPRASEVADMAINDALRKFLEPGFYVPIAVKVKQIEKIIEKKRRVR